MRISKTTRKNIADAITVSDRRWQGNLTDSKMLSRIYDLSSLPSHDPRFSDAAGDITQHRENNYDWDDEWVFDDLRFNLMGCDDDKYLEFLSETIHPVVRPDLTETAELRDLYNNHLSNDGFELFEKGRIGPRTVYGGRYIGSIPSPDLALVKDAHFAIDADYVSQQIKRMTESIETDPWLAIGTAKEFVETCCKTLLNELSISTGPRPDLAKLVKLTTAKLALTPADISEQAKAAQTIKRLLNNLAQVSQGLAELRNSYGTGHGKEAGNKGLTARHARLAVGASSTLVVFLVETHKARITEKT